MKRIVCAVLLSVFIAILIWLIVGFVRWDLDLSGMEFIDRKKMVFWWAFLSAILVPFAFFNYITDSEAKTTDNG